MKVWPTEVSTAEAVPVIFAATRAAALAAAIERPAVAIIADFSTYNNFGKNYWSKLHILDDGPRTNPIDVMLMFEGKPNTHKHLAEVFAERGVQWIAANKAELPFATVMNHETGYATMVGVLGFPIAVATLRAMGDAVVLEIEADDARVAMVSSLAFHEGALRNAETYYAYRNGARHLTPTPPVHARDAKGTYMFAAMLPGVDAATDAAFDFTTDELLRDRLNVLIGRNGVGKSQLVQSMIEGLRLHPDSRGETSTKAAIIEVMPPFSRLIVMSSVASDTYPRSIPAWSGLDYKYVSLIQQSEEGPNRLLWTLLDCFRDPGEQSFHFKGKELNRFGLLKLLLGRFGFWEHLAVPLREAPPLTSDMFPMAENINGQRYVRLTQLSGEQRSVRIATLMAPNEQIGILDDGQVRRLSSGETAMLRFAILAVSMIDTASMLVLEEPETYLHPNYVSELMSILHDLLQATSSVAIVVTHSAYVVREATRQRVNVLTRDEDGQPVFAVTPIQTFGASIDSISQFVFGDGLISLQFRETLKDWVQANPDLSLGQLRERYATEFTPETISYVAGLINDRASTVEF